MDPDMDMVANRSLRAMEVGEVFRRDWADEMRIDRAHQSCDLNLRVHVNAEHGRVFDITRHSCDGAVDDHTMDHIMRRLYVECTVVNYIAEAGSSEGDGSSGI